MEIKRIVVGLLKTNCYLLYDKEEMVVVDPGAEGKKIVEETKRIGITPKHIINTHSHPDHNFANRHIEKATKAKLLENLQEEDKIEIGDSFVEILHTPGHTKDSICLKGEGFLIGGDVLFIDGHGRTDLPGGSADEMKETLKRLKTELSEETIIYPGHGEEFKMKEWSGDY